MRRSIEMPCILWISFVLSGFVISYAYSHRLKDGRDAGNFLIRRFGRLWPLHVTTLAALVSFDLIRIAMKVATHQSTSPFLLAQQPVMGMLSIISQIFMVHAAFLPGVFPTPFEWNYPSWSISIEFYVCVAFALISAGAGRSKNVVFLGILVLLFACGLTGHLPPQWAIYRGAYGFLIGHFIYWLYARAKLVIPGATFLEAVTLVAVLTYAGLGNRLNNGLNFGFYVPLAFGLAVFVFAHEGGLVSRLFKIKAAQKLGEWSYSIYLVHVLVLQALGVYSRRAGVHQMLVRLPDLGGPSMVDAFSSPWYGDLVVIFYMIIVIALASQTYRYIEKPARKFFYRFADARCAETPVRP